MTRYSDMATKVDSKSTTFGTFQAKKRLALNKKREEDKNGTVRGAIEKMNRNQKESNKMLKEPIRHAVSINMKSIHIEKDFEVASDDKIGVKNMSLARQ